MTNMMGDEVQLGEVQRTTAARHGCHHGSLISVQNSLHRQEIQVCQTAWILNSCTLFYSSLFRCGIAMDCPLSEEPVGGPPEQPLLVIIDS